jgi:O-antigen/teichoic acid export membrane protein
LSPSPGAEERVTVPAAGGLRDRTAHGVKWSVLHTVGVRAVGLAVFLLLARVLAPQAFGLFALAQSVILLIQAVCDTALSAVVVQREELTGDFLDALFWVTMLVGVGLLVAGAAGGAALARVLGQPALGPLLRVLSASFLIAGFSTVQTGLLRREFRFRTEAVRSLAGEAAGGVAAVAAALAGAGVWSLVVYRLVADAVASAVLWASTSWRPRWRFPAAALRGTAGFALSVSGARLVWAVGTRADDLLVGVFLGPIALGYYAVAYRIVEVLANLFTNSLIQVALASFSRVRQDRERLQRVLLSALRLTSLVGVPVFLWLIVTADAVVPVLFGARWLPSVPVMRVLAVLGLVRSLQTHGETVLIALGRPDLVMRIEAIRTLVMILGFLLVVDRGIIWVAWVLVLTQYCASPVLALLVARLTGVRLRDLAAQYVPAAVAGAAMAAVAWIVHGSLAGPAGALRLGGELAMGAAVYLGSAWLVDRESVRTAAQFAKATLRA